MSTQLRHQAHGLVFTFDADEHLGTGRGHFRICREGEDRPMERALVDTPVDPAAFVDLCESWIRRRLGAVDPVVVSCAACGRELEPVFPRATEYQFDNALWVRFSGGYGMFIDDVADFGETDEPVREHSAVLCHTCAHDLCDRVAWIERMLEPEYSHSHREDHVAALEAAGHRGWDLAVPDGDAPTGNAPVA